MFSYFLIYNPRNRKNDILIFNYYRSRMAATHSLRANIGTDESSLLVSRTKNLKRSSNTLASLPISKFYPSNFSSRKLFSCLQFSFLIFADFDLQMIFTFFKINVFRQVGRSQRRTPWQACFHPDSYCPRSLDTIHQPPRCRPMRAQRPKLRNGPCARCARPTA
jgi:hypothetical protein